MFERAACDRYRHLILGIGAAGKVRCTLAALIQEKAES